MRRRGWPLLAAGQCQLPAVPPPPGNMRVERGAHDPGPRRRMLAYLPPRRPGPGEGLRDQVLGQLPVAHADQHNPQAIIPGRRVELRELLPVILHTPYTHEQPDSLHPVQSARTVRTNGLSVTASDQRRTWASARVAAVISTPDLGVFAVSAAGSGLRRGHVIYSGVFAVAAVRGAVASCSCPSFGLLDDFR